MRSQLSVACALSLFVSLAVPLRAGDGAGAAGAACGLLVQQGPASILLGSPLGITSRQDPTLRVKTSGFDPGKPPNWPASLPRPDFERLVAEITPPTVTVPVPLLAMSLGIDVLAVGDEKLVAADFPAEPAPPSATGDYPVLRVGAHGWYAIEFTVDSQQVGTNPDLAPDIVAAKGETDGSVFCYVLPASTAKLLPVEQESIRVLTPAALGIGPTDGIEAMNMHAGLYWTDLASYPDVFTTRPLPLDAAVYFTLDVDRLKPQQRDALRSAWGVEGVSPLVIYCTRWSGGHWSTPQTYTTAAALQITAPPGSAIDGLALDTKCTLETDDDELLYSLRGTTTTPVPAAMQVMHVAVKTKNPRPVVVRRRGGDGYGSLGRQMRGGQGIGDMCTADPWVLDGRQKSFQSADPLVDDFLIARRLPPDGPYVVTESGGEGASLFAWLGPEPVAESCFGGVFVPESWQLPAAPQRPIVVLPGQSKRLLPPELGLAIAGFRLQDAEGPMMRACMSWPAALAASGDATVRWGWIGDYTVPTTDPGNVHWEGSLTKAYAGVPFVHDCELPGDGVLKPDHSGSGAGVPVSASGPTAKSKADSRKAFLMQWTLRADGCTYISSIAALRY